MVNVCNFIDFKILTLNEDKAEFCTCTSAKSKNEAKMLQDQDPGRLGPQKPRLCKIKTLYRL